jgi:hypothetical protein
MYYIEKQAEWLIFDSTNPGPFCSSQKQKENCLELALFFPFKARTTSKGMDVIQLINAWMR